MSGIPVRRTLSVAAMLALFMTAGGAVAGTVVINEFRTRTTVSPSDEFIELYNATSSPIDIGGWNVSASNNAGSTSVRATLPVGTILNGGCFYLLANSGGYSGATIADLSYTTGITDDGGIALIMADGITIVDQVGMSSGSAYKEGTPLPAMPSNTSGSYGRNPVGRDFDNNATDFQFNTVATPQNHGSACFGSAPASPTDVIARATVTSNVFISWAASASAASYRVQRSDNGTAFSTIATTSNTYYDDVTVAPATSYLYRVIAVDASSNTSPPSSAALATTVIFDDLDLAAGMFVKSNHVLQLRTAIDAVRMLASMTAGTYGGAITPGTSFISASDIDDLRNALGPARAALGIPVAGYTDPTLNPGITVVRATHITELRDLVNGHRRPGYCDPGTGTCSGSVSTYCGADGLTMLTETCDPTQASFCSAQTGRCSGSCGLMALAQYGNAPIGCDFAPTVTANITSSSYDFAVAVANATANSATITVTKGNALINTYSVPANSATTILLPWEAPLKGPDDLSGSVPFPASILDVHGAYRLRSTEPVTAFQYNPLEYAMSSTFSYTNDASRLWPAHLWGTAFRVVSWPHFQPYSGFYAVTAHDDNTTVTATAPASLVIKAGTALGTTGSGTVTLNAGDVLEIVTDSGPTAYDVTGTLLSSTKPVQVIGGHQCTNVPVGVSFCDHLEETLPPVPNASSSYVLVAPVVPGGATKVRQIRIIGTQDSTTLTYDPAQAAALSINSGGVVDYGPTTATFHLTSSKPVIVAELMTGQNADANNTGDPSMLITTGTDQYRTSYAFVAPPNYPNNYVNIVAPAGATVTLDGTPVPSGHFAAVGASGYSAAHEPLSATATGMHLITASAPIGISVYGYGSYVTYSY